MGKERKDITHAAQSGRSGPRAKRQYHDEISRIKKRISARQRIDSGSSGPPAMDTDPDKEKEKGRRRKSLLGKRGGSGSATSSGTGSGTGPPLPPRIRTGPSSGTMGSNGPVGNPGIVGGRGMAFMAGRKQGGDGSGGGGGAGGEQNSFPTSTGRIKRLSSMEVIETPVSHSSASTSSSPSSSSQVPSGLISSSPPPQALRWVTRLSESLPASRGSIGSHADKGIDKGDKGIDKGDRVDRQDRQDRMGRNDVEEWADRGGKGEDASVAMAMLSSTVSTIPTIDPLTLGKNPGMGGKVNGVNHGSGMLIPMIAIPGILHRYEGGLWRLGKRAGWVRGGIGGGHRDVWFRLFLILGDGVDMWLRMIRDGDQWEELHIRWMRSLSHLSQIMVSFRVMVRKKKEDGIKVPLMVRIPLPFCRLKKSQTVGNGVERVGEWNLSSHPPLPWSHGLYVHLTRQGKWMQIFFSLPISRASFSFFFSYTGFQGKVDYWLILSSLESSLLPGQECSLSVKSRAKADGHWSRYTEWSFR